MVNVEPMDGSAEARISGVDENVWAKTAVNMTIMGRLQGSD